MTSESCTRRVGGCEVVSGVETVMLLVHGPWPGAAQMSPDDADALADQLRAQAAGVRRLAQG